MCGITGFIDKKYDSSEGVLRQMNDALIHRGPDDSDLFVKQLGEAKIGLGHRRLSIIDLSENGRQPMRYEHLSVVFNGEIYNYREIKAELAGLGHRFQTASDTEVLLHAFDEWGEAAVHRFIGMFAFALLDERAECLYLFRDRPGVKPLYYYRDGGFLLFASELKAFHAHPHFKKKINLDALAFYLQHGYVISPYCIFEQCRQVQPGHFVKIDLQKNQLLLEEKKYWDVYDFYNKPELKISELEAKAHLDGLLKSAFDYRMVADVPVGVFLSGGYDSTAVAAMIQSGNSQKLKTFTIGFEEEDFNEAPFAKRVAEHLGTDHTEQICTFKEARDIIPELPLYFDEPMGDSSAIPTILVSRVARRDVTVALSADGGDEIFAGYKRYDKIVRWHRNASLVPARVRSVAGSFIPPNALLDGLPYVGERINNVNAFRHLFEKKINPGLILKDNMGVKDFAFIRSMMREKVTRLESQFDISTLCERDDELSRALAVDYQTYLPGDVLNKVDRATMSVSLEGREPLLDHRIIEFAAQLPLHFKYGPGGQKKYLFKNIVHDYVPEALMDRPKRGFGVPVSRWFRHELKYLFDEFLNKEYLTRQGIFDPSIIQHELRLYQNGSNRPFTFLWFLLIFQMWHKKWMN